MYMLDHRDIDWYRNRRDGFDDFVCNEEELSLLVNQLSDLGIKASTEDADDFWGWYSQTAWAVMHFVNVGIDDKEAKDLALHFFKIVPLNE